MGLLSDPHLFVEVYLAKYPASLGTQTLRLTRIGRPISRAGAFYQPRITGVGEIARACTDPDGNYEIGSFLLTIADDDGEIGELLDANQPTEYWYARELALWVISYEGLLAGLTTATVAPVARGWISGAQRNGRAVAVTVSDVLGSQFSGFNLDKKALQIAVKDLTTPPFSTPREDTKDVKLPIFVGEFSDRGALDSTGVAASRGLVNVTEVCEIDITNLNGIPEPTYPAPPIILDAHVVGPGGGATNYYAAVLVTPYGESAMSNIVKVENAPATEEMSISNYVEISGTYDDVPGADINDVYILGRKANPPTKYLDGVNWRDPNVNPPQFGYLDGAANYPTPYRDEIDIEKTYTPTGGAQTNANIWSIMAVCLGYDYDLLDVYASDLAEDGEPKRALIGAAEHGVTFILPTDPQWPYPNPWIEMNGIKFTAFLARGLKLEHHRAGTVTMGVNFCGPHGANGLVINQAFRALQFLLNEHAVKNKGTGYRNGTYGTLETYANGDALLQTSTFEACQALTVGWIGGLGYLASLFVVDPEETWRDVVRKFCQTFGARLAANRFGQIKALLVNTVPDAVEGRHFRERIEIKRTEESLLAHDQIVNSYRMQWFYDPSAAAYRGRDVIQKEESIAAHVPGGVVGVPDMRGLHEEDREQPFTADEATARDAIERELVRRQRRPRYPVITVPMLGLDHDLGARARLTDSHGLGASGDVATKTLVLRHVTRVDEQEVTLGLLDLRGVNTDLLLKPGAGSLSLTGLAPYISRIGVPRGSLGLTGRAPTLDVRLVFSPPTGALDLAGLAPVAPIFLSLPAGALSLSGLAGSLTDVRITEAGDTRITEAGDTRETW